MSGNLRFIEAEQITEAVAELCVKSNICIGNDIRSALSEARAIEMSPLAQTALDTILENAEIAELNDARRECR